MVYCVSFVLLCRLQHMRDNNLMKDGDWMTKKEAIRDNLPADFTDEDIRKRLHEVSGVQHGTCMYMHVHSHVLCS